MTGMCCKLVKPFREDGQALRLNEKPNAGDITGSHSYTNYTSEVHECASLGTCGYVDDQPFNSSRVVGSQLYNVAPTDRPVPTPSHARAAPPCLFSLHLYAPLSKARGRRRRRQRGRRTSGDIPTAR